jgi:hypothetical protein
LLSSITTLEEEEEEHGLNGYFEENGYESKILVMNLGSTLIFLMIQLGLYAIYPIINLVSKAITW